MKIVHVVPSFARGGGERLMIELANRETAAGHDVTIVAAMRLPDDQVHGGLSGAVEVRFVSDRPVSGAAMYGKMLPWIWRQREWLGRQDVLHCHLTYGAAFGTLVRCMQPKRMPVVVETYHAVGMPIPKWQRWLHARMAGFRDGLSFMAADPYWDRFRNRRPRIASAIIPAGVSEPSLGTLSTEEREEYRSRIGMPADAGPVVGTIGRLSPDRQSHRYIPVFAAIARELGSGVHFLMGGDGPERGRIEVEIEAAGLRAQVHLPGLVRDLGPPMSIMDLYITSSIGPVPGVAGLQAVAAGLPVIAIQLADKYVPGEEDWIWSSADPERVAAQVVELLRSPERAAALARAQREHLERSHSPGAMAAAYEALYRKARMAREGAQAESAGA